MVLALFYVVAIQSARLRATTRGMVLTIKSVHLSAPKIKQFLQSRKYIYFCRHKLYIVEKESLIYYQPGVRREKEG